MSQNPLLALMHQGESGTAGYNAYNRGTYTGDDGKQHIRGADRRIDFSQMTMGQVLDAQALPNGDPNRVFAVGKYQIIPATMRDSVDALGIDRNQQFTPQVQDRIFSEYLIVDKRPDIRNYITGQPGASLTQAQHALSLEWASFGDPSKGGASHYGGANHASITLQQSGDALNQMRDEYRAAIGRGLSPDQAWRATIDDNPNRTLPASITAPRTQGGGANRDAMADGMLTLNERGPAVTALQERLSALGYRDAEGNALKPDGHYGERTKEVVERFQREHGLTDDGKAGRNTLEALRTAQPTQATPQQPGEQTPGARQPGAADPQQPANGERQPLGPAPLSNPHNPNNPLYQQAIQGLEKIGPNGGFADREQMERAAATLTYEAKVSGLNRIDHVVPNANGTGLFAVQGGLNDPSHHRVHVDRQQAVGQSVEQTSQQLRQDVPQPTLQPAPDSQAQERSSRTMMA
ncbi:peptidoglycan-binding protein [Lysobacter sp. K5869]|uniref:peptidoglycan-binding domain-containing protein n=1 Tax=Lysobacter sp. K5869 TaxID=2820808 RepID=UPI001C063DB1|nr:peptidoglycan-binding domain-containing protein [Lysobacter sp. K5869]QWP78398.1 peptidoglycan-binding protein [Lysobacter sp. K5869]